MYIHSLFFSSECAMITVIVHSNPIVVTDTFARALHFLLSFSYFFFLILLITDAPREYGANP